MYEIVSLDSAIAKIKFELEDIAGSIDLAFDVETIGFYGKIRLAQFYCRGWERAVLVENPNPYELFTFFSKNKTQLNLVMQYCTYEISTIQANTGSRWIPELFEDTFYLARLAYPNLSEYSLDALIVEVLGRDPYKAAGLDKTSLQKSDWGKMLLTPEQQLYAALDVFYLLDLYDMVKVQADSFNYKLDKHTIRHMVDFQCNGFPVDKNRCQKHYADNLAKIAAIALPINANSYVQVRPYIGSTESDDLGLIRQTLLGNDRAKQVRDVRKLRKQNSFLDKFDTDDGRIYGHFAPAARSGRATCSDQNLQQLPRALKDCFGFDPEAGRVLIYSDYSQLELRSIGAITGERAIIQLYSEGKDLHNYVAEMIFGPDYTKDQRQIAKTCNFNLLYGGGAEMLQSILLKQANMLVPVEELKRIQRKWKRLFPTIAMWQEQGVRNYHRNILGSTPLGRRYKANMMTDQLNIENQGFGAEVAKLAMHYMAPEIKKLGAQIDNFIHDSYILECDDDPAIYEAVSIVVAESMKEAWVEATKCVKVTNLPMPVSVAVGYNWGDIESGQVIHTYKIAA